MFTRTLFEPYKNFSKYISYLLYKKCIFVPHTTFAIILIRFQTDPKMYIEVTKYNLNFIYCIVSFVFNIRFTNTY